MPLTPEQLLASPFREVEKTITSRELVPLDDILALVLEIEPGAANEFDLEAEGLRRHMHAVLQEAGTIADAIRIVRRQLELARASRQKARDRGRPGIAVGWDTRGRAELAAELAPEADARTRARRARTDALRLQVRGEPQEDDS
jgi:hypothetical protein